MARKLKVISKRKLKKISFLEMFKFLKGIMLLNFLKEFVIFLMISKIIPYIVKNNWNQNLYCLKK